MLQAAIFDLNGIFIQSPKLSDRFEKDFGISTDIFLPKLSMIMNAVRQPDSDNAFSYWEAVLKEWNVTLTEDEFWQYWFSGEHVSDTMVAYARELREQGVQVFILSNNFKERAKFYGSYPWIHEVVDKVYFSFETGFVKPNPQAWQHLLDENNLAAADCIYFDDQQKNLDAAASLGIEAYMFTNEDSLKDLVNAKL